MKVLLPLRTKSRLDLKSRIVLNLVHIYPPLLGGYIFKVALAECGTGAGIVRGIGKNVHVAAVGDPVLLSFHACFSCEQCKKGHPAYCNSFAQENYAGRGQLMSVRESGEGLWARFFGQSSFAHYSVVSEASIVNAKELLHDDNELELFAPLGCGFQTGMGAVQNIAMAGTAETVMIIGLGAVGMGALMVLFSLISLAIEISSLWFKTLTVSV